MIRVLWMPAFAGMTMLFSTQSFAQQDETPAYINALATYAESKVIGDSGLERIIDGCGAGQITNPLTLEVARVSTDKLLAFETLQEYIDNADLDAGRVCVWAKEAQAERQQQQQEREKSREDTVQVFEETDRNVIATGFGHTCAIASNGILQCWGDNAYGQCDVPLDLGPVISVSSTGWHTCVITVDGTARCWGRDGCGAAVPSDLGEVRSISAAITHTCAIKEDGAVYCWGSNTHSQLGDAWWLLGKARSVSAGGHHTCVVRENGSVDCWGSNWHGARAVPPDLGEVHSVSIGMDYSCAVKVDSKIRCWGRFSYESTDQSHYLLRPISAGDDHPCAIAADGTAWCWGESRGLEIPIPTDLGRIRSISVGTWHACAVSEDGTLRCFGNNRNHKHNYNQTDVPEGLCLLGFDCGGAKR